MTRDPRSPDDDNAPNEGVPQDSAPGETPPGDAKPLTGRRDVLGTIARVTAASLVAAVAPRIASAQLEPFGAEPIPWRNVLVAARKSIAFGVDTWTERAQIVEGQLNGSGVFLPPGALKSDGAFADQVEAALLEVGAPPTVAAAFAGVSWEVWEAWASSYHAAFGQAFPEFAAVPGPESGTLKMDVKQLRAGSAPGSLGISEEIVVEALVELIGEPAETWPGASAVSSFAGWYDRSFRRWFRRAELVNLVGGGPVPSFAPPYVPVGPVVSGFVSGVGVLVAPPFG